MKETRTPYKLPVISVFCGLMLVLILFAGCTQSTTSTPETTVATTEAVTVTSTPVATTTPAVPITVATTAIPAPTYTPSRGNLVIYTTASLSGASQQFGSFFTRAYPGNTVVFDFDRTQTLKSRIESGAYADVFISASNSSTNSLKDEGYFVNDSIEALTTNSVIVILPASNPANIQSLANLAKPGVKIAMATNTVPVGAATIAFINSLANTTYGQNWKNSTMGNVVTWETSEPAVADKVSLGEVDAGFVYQSTASSGTFQTLPIPKNDNYLQTYTIGILQGSANKDAAAEFEQLMVSPVGQQILEQYGFATPSKPPVYWVQEL
jgi:molybdate transport system substrate-binding protein